MQRERGGLRAERERQPQFSAADGGALPYVGSEEEGQVTLLWNKSKILVADVGCTSRDLPGWALKVLQHSKVRENQQNENVKGLPVIP